MPDYATHQKINAIVLFLFTLVNITILSMYGISTTIQSVYFAISFILSSWVLTPDLDTKSKPFYRWSYAKIVWIAFQKFSNHRGILHDPIFSPIILCFPLIIVQWKLGLNYEFVGIYAGITAQIEIHILLDWVVSWKKEKAITNIV